MSLSVAKSDDLRSASNFEKLTGRFLTPVWKNAGTVAPSELVGWSHIRLFHGYSVGVLSPDPFHLGQENEALVPLRPSSANTYDQTPELFDATDLQRVNKRTDQLIAWGYIQYRDPFPGAPVHRISWCRKLVFALGSKEMRADWILHSPDCDHED